MTFKNLLLSDKKDDNANKMKYKLRWKVIYTLPTTRKQTRTCFTLPTYSHMIVDLTFTLTINLLNLKVIVG